MTDGAPREMGVAKAEHLLGHFISSDFTLTLLKVTWPEHLECLGCDLDWVAGRQLTWQAVW